jgi:hypothetical protein
MPAFVLLTVSITEDGYDKKLVCICILKLEFIHKTILAIKILAASHFFLIRLKTELLLSFKRG